MHSSSSCSLLDDFTDLSVATSSSPSASVIELALALLEFFHALPEPLFGDGSLFVECFRDEEHFDEGEVTRKRLENILRQSLDKNAHASATYTLAFLTSYVGRNSPSSSIRLESVCQAFADVWFAKTDSSTKKTNGFSLVRRMEIVKTLLSSSGSSMTQYQQQQELSDLFSTSTTISNATSAAVTGSLLDL